MSNDSRTYDYDTYKYYEDSKKEDITSGLRKDDSVRVCQYWVKGLSARCEYWNEELRICGYDLSEGKPSGYNFGKCDYLGRRFDCDKYSAGENEDLNKYWCILPNIFLSGVGKRVRDEEGNLTSDVTIYPVSVEDIKGYCRGECDGFGRGTGCGGSGDVDKDPVVCNYYRPWQMGFGAEEPRPLEFQYVDGERIITPDAIEKAYEAVSTPMGIRLPFSFKIFNNRAYFQKCMHWDDDYGARFQMADDGSIKIYNQVGNEIDPSGYCTKDNPNAREHCELHEDPSSEWILRHVWSKANTIVCNGAKPECPCYTGRWVYCTDANMLDGMRITANQIFELRFWARNWISQAEYDTYFKRRPNFLDVSTSDIFTFKKWLRLNPTDPSQSIMEGRRVTMCMPAPIHKRFFVPEEYLETEIIQYGAINIDEGTTAPEENQVYYPSLVRDIEVFEHQPLDIMYPYATNSPWSDEVCISPDNEAIPYVKKGISLDGDYISAVGATIRNCSVYFVNLTNIEQPEESSGPGLHLIYDMLLTNLNSRELSEETPVLTGNEGDETNTSGLSEKDKFNMNVEFFIDYCLKYSPENIATSISNLEGYFAISKVLLKYGVLNQMVVLVRFPNDEWDFRKVSVQPQLCGGALIQTSFSANNPNHAPLWVEGSEINGKVAMIGDNSKYGSYISLDSITSVIGHNYSTLDDEYFEYSYCIKKVTKENEEITQWGRIGNTSCIWVEIEDTNINHLFEWGIDSAIMSVVTTDDEEFDEETEGEEEVSISCDDVGEVELKQKDIETWVSGKLSIPPSACVLEPKDGEPIAFHNDTCVLKVTYWYKKFSNTSAASEGEEIIWPDFFQDNVYFSEPSVNIDISNDKFTIQNVVDDTVALMAFFKDESGRKIACMATKLIVWIPTITCRNVEIYYKYKQPTVWYKLKPETSLSNLATPPTSEEAQGEYAPRVYKARCGDHESGNVCMNGPGIGPMWYPYTDCDQRDFYKCFAGSNYCTNYYPNTPRDDMRFCGPTVYTAWVDGGGSGAYADCVLSFHYRYSKTIGSPTFIGFANIIARVDINEYKTNCWTLPPFGNKGREMIEKWLSEEHWPHLTYKTTIPSIKREWVPIVPDKESFFLSFNAFEESSEITDQNFKFTSQMNFMLSNLISEEISSGSDGNFDRKRFDEVFGLRGIYMATYPPPLIPYASAAKVAHYYFKDVNAAWAWREFWKAIEYVSERALFFVNYNKPEYVYAQDKNEHRYICEEGSHKITFKSPVIQKGKLVFFPGIQLGNGVMRYFEIRYDNYEETQVEWKDEDEGYVDASNDSADGGGSIYQKTAPGEDGSQWSHDENVLFDDEAVESYEDAEIDERVIDVIDGVTGEITKTYYNRGLIASIKRSNLKYIPYDETVSDVVFDKENTDKAEDAVPELDVSNLGLPDKFIYIWHDISPTLDISAPDVYADKEICISRIFIKGSWGVYKPSINAVDLEYLNVNFGINLNEKTYNIWDGYKICKPGISVTIESLERPTEVVFTSQPIAYNKELHKNIGLMEYNFEIPVQPTVERMFYKPDHTIKVKFTCVPEHFLILGADAYSHNTASYTDSEELIYVYERKFFTSKGSNFGDYNLNGPKQDGNFPLQYELDLDNSGVYFPAHPQFGYVKDSPCTGKDKLRSVYAGTQYREDQPLSISLSNIESIEMNEQKNLYDAAYSLNEDGDRLVYTIIVPPNIEKYLKDNNIELLSDANGNCVFTTGINDWTDTGLYLSYKPGSGIWFPQGHKFMWGADVKKMFCYEQDFMPEYETSGYGRFNILDVSFVHMDYFGLEIASDPLSALYGNRMAFQISVALKTFGQDAKFSEAGRLMGTAASFIDNSNVGDIGVISY